MSDANLKYFNKEKGRFIEVDDDLWLDILKNNGYFVDIQDKIINQDSNGAYGIAKVLVINKIQLNCL